VTVREASPLLCDEHLVWSTLTGDKCWLPHFCVMGKGWRDDFIDLMAGVPQIADNLLQHSKSSALGQQRTCLTCLP
jgi:hypothetical protein